MQEKAGRHHPLAAQQVRGNGDAEPGDRADDAHSGGGAAGNGAGNQQSRGAGRQRVPFRFQSRHYNLGQKDDDDAVAGAAPIMNANQVPESGRLANLPQKNPRALLRPLARSRSPPRRRRALISQLPQSHILRRIVKNAGQQQQNHAPDDAGNPERHPYAQNIGAAAEGQPFAPYRAAARAEPGHQPQHYRQCHYRAKSLGRLQQPHAHAQMLAEPGSNRHRKRHLENAH